jgi:hypothetical protein
MEMSDQVHALAALPPGKEPLVPIGQEDALIGGRIISDSKQW